MTSNIVDLALGFSHNIVISIAPEVKVETISLNDVMDKKFNGIAPSYVSIDTEGSEYEILHSFNFEKYRPIVFTIEHNYSQLENKIDKLMISNGYARVFRKLTAFDLRSTLEKHLRSTLEKHLRSFQKIQLNQ